jgi:hypothetical protein
MNKLEDFSDYLKCACYNRVTLFGYISLPVSFCMLGYAFIEKEPLIGLSGCALTLLSLTANAVTENARGTLKQYRKAKRTFANEENLHYHLKGLEDMPYCGRRGIELAILERDRDKLGSE